MGSGSETEAKEEEENNKEWDRDGETPMRAQVEAVNVGGEVTPRGKTLTYLTSNLKLRICCCRESMETNRITTMGLIWTGELHTTLSGSLVGDG